MRDEIVDTLLELMGIDSDNRADKAPIVRYATDRLTEIGMDVSIVGESDCPAICATRGEGGLAISGHLDTVPVGDYWTHDQGEIVDGRIYGRGTMDMKGAVAASLHAAGTLAEEDVSFAVLLTTDEEEGMKGALALSRLEVVRQATGIIICEPTDMQPVTREKGVLRFRLMTKGRAAHSSQPWVGENAILRMYRLLTRLEDLVVEPGFPTEEMTTCLTTISGGTKNNVVPDACSTEIDMRFPPPMTYQRARSLIEERLAGMEYSIEPITELEAFETTPDSALLRYLKEYLGKGPIGVPYATEAARYGRVNGETCVCGPGKPGLAHMADEWVPIDQLVDTYEMLVELGRALQG